MSTKRQDAVIRLHVPCQLDPSLCACDELTDWSPQHVLDELDKVGYGLFYKHHVQVYADIGTKYAALMREVYFLTQSWRAGADASWRAGADASSPPEFATLDDCAGQLERAAKLPSPERRGRLKARHRKPDGRLWNYVKFYFGRGHDPFDYRPRPTYRVKRGVK